MNSLGNQLCISLNQGDFTWEEITNMADWFELRVDCWDDPYMLPLPLPVDKKIIVTCRKDSRWSDSERIRIYRFYLDRGVKYVDLDLVQDEFLIKALQTDLESNSAALIASFHDFEKTPELALLEAIYQQGHRLGATWVKIACLTHNRADLERIEAFYDQPGLIIFGMGEAGRASRLESLRHGAPFTYVYLGRMGPTAPGQWSWEEIQTKITDLQNPKGL